MKPVYILGLCIFSLSCSTPSKSDSASDLAARPKKWVVVFQDDFNATGSFEPTKWEYCTRHTAPWTKYLTNSPEYAYLDGSNLVLKMDDKSLAGDDAPYHSGGIKTQGKFSFTYGKVEVRARFSEGRGSWPAIWMMPENSTYGGWPASGEIDIMEHVNNEPVVHQTIHNAAVTNANGGSTATKSSAYNKDEYNLYGLIWTPEAIQFYVNNQLQFTYAREANATSRQWPFNRPFYLILNQSGGAGWPGPVTDADLPFAMEVDWVKVYQEK